MKWISFLANLLMRKLNQVVFYRNIIPAFLLQVTLYSNNSNQRFFFFWWTLIHFQSVSSSAFNDLNIFLNIYFPCNIHTTHFLLIFVCIEWKYWLLYGITKHLKNTDKTSILKASTVDGWAVEFLGVRVTLQCVTASLFGENWKKKRRAQKKL